MTTLLYLCQSQRRARRVLRPEARLAVPTCTLWASSVNILPSGWNCLSGVDGDHVILSAGASVVRRLSGGSEGIQCPWDVRSQLTTPKQPPLLPPQPLSSTPPGWKRAEAETEAPEKQHHGDSLRAWSASYLQGPAQNKNAGPPC